MNQLIERYVFDVTRRLKENERIEVAKELESMISDMLPENPSEGQIIDVINQLGDPRLMAEQYRGKPQYLISPAVFDMYFTTLKLVIPIVAIVLAVIGVISTIFDLSIPFSVYRLFSNMFGLAFSGIFQAAALITIGFVIYDYLELKKEWTISNLPEKVIKPVEKKLGISRAESIAGIVMTIFFTVLFIAMILRNEWFFFFVKDGHLLIPFSEAALNRAIPYLIIGGILGVTVGIFKLYYARWTKQLFIIDTIYNVVWAGILLYVVNWPDLFNPNIEDIVTLYLDDTDFFLRIIDTGGQLIRNISSAAVIIITVIGIATAAVSTYRTNKLQ